MGRRGCDPNFLGYIVLVSSDKTRVIREAEIKGRGRKLKQILNQRSKIYSDHKEDLSIDANFNVLMEDSGKLAESVSSSSALANGEIQASIIDQTNQHANKLKISKRTNAINNMLLSTSNAAVISTNFTNNAKATYSEVNNIFTNAPNETVATAPTTDEKCHINDGATHGIEETGEMFFFNLESPAEEDDDLSRKFFDVL